MKSILPWLTGEIGQLFGNLMDQAVSFTARLDAKKNLQKYLQVLSFVARRGIEPYLHQSIYQ
ncbi:hypothetical protein [Sphingobacterium sp.]|uniref:hypothetical protein n=1 Tax=Sphingobacterium sp. TaxID=341027 RepID=UPI002FD8ED7B